MNLKCILGSHAWNGCRCLRCGKTRDEGHNWKRDCEECSGCKKTQPDAHDWSQDCEKCSRCEKSRTDAHLWSDDRKKCLRCHKALTHSDRLNALFRSRTRRSGDANAAWYSVLQEFGTTFQYRITDPPGKDHHDELQAAINPVFSRHHKEGRGMVGFDDFTYGAICVDEDEICAIETELEQVLSGAGLKFKKLSPARCDHCGRRLRTSAYGSTCNMCLQKLGRI